MVGARCPSREELIAYLVGTADEETAEAVIGHADGCRACQAALGTLEDAADALIAQLRRPVWQNACLDEPQCHEAIARAEAVAPGKSLSVEAHAAAQGPLPAQLGEYRLLEKLDEGGMGRVYKARHTELDRVVALKALPAGRLANDRAIARFRREIKAAGRLDHPNIVRALDARQIEGTHLLVMEYVDGLDLSELVRRLGPLPIADACELIRQAALALQCAHEHGLVHRDIKPSNLMLARDGLVKLLDLGLARIAMDQPAGEEMTGTGQAMGTADYMAPEQVADSHEVDIRADVYSLGCTLYKLLGGHAPFSGPKYKSNFDKMAAHVREPPPPITGSRGGIPDQLVAVLHRMLEKDPQRRYATPGEVAEALGPLGGQCDLPGVLAEAERKVEPLPQSGKAIVTDQFRSSALAGTRPSHRAEAVLAAGRRRKLLVLAVAAAAVVLLAGMVIYYFKTGRGTLVLKMPEQDVKDVKVTIDGQQVRVKKPRERIAVAVGRHRLKVIKAGRTAYAAPFTVRWRGEELELRAWPGQLFTEQAGWPHKGQNLENTNYLARPSSPLGGKLELDLLWYRPRAMAIRTADLDGDGNLEVVYLQKVGRAHPLVAVDGDGDELWRRDPVGDSAVTHPDVQVFERYDVGDTDGDGDCEIVVNVNCGSGWTGGRPNRILIYGGDGTLLGNFAAASGGWADPLLGDVTGNGKAEIVVGLADYQGEHGAYVYDVEGRLLGRTLTGEALDIQAIADIDGDGVNEALLSNFASHNRQPELGGVDAFHAHLVAIEADGSLMWVRRIGTCNVSAAAADFAGHGNIEILALRRQSLHNYPGPNEVHLLDSLTGRTLAKYVGPPDTSWRSWVVGDLGGDGFKEIALGNPDGRIRVLNSKLKLIRERTWTARADVWAGNDLDGDGAAELVAAVEETIYVLDGNLETKCTFNLSAAVRDAIVSDVDSDGVNEVLVETGAGLSVLTLCPPAARTVPVGE